MAVAVTPSTDRGAQVDVTLPSVTVVPPAPLTSRLNEFRARTPVSSGVTT